MENLRQLTETYVEAFNGKNLGSVAALLDDDFSLSDPTVTDLRPKQAALQLISDLFIRHNTLVFQAQRILVDAPCSVIQFTLTLDETTYDGVDLIVWEYGKMIRMVAYLTPRT